MGNIFIDKSILETQTGKGTKLLEKVEQSAGPGVISRDISLAVSHFGTIKRTIFLYTTLEQQDKLF